jgi:hypothetical protein
MYIKKRPKFCVRYWLGKYSAVHAYEVSIGRWYTDEKIIEQFVRTFPKKKSLEKFLACDVQDFRLMHPAIDIRPVKVFWEWLKEQGLPGIGQIVFMHRPLKLPKRKSNLSLVDGIRLLGECDSIELKRKVIGAISGESCALAPRLREQLGTAAIRAGLPVDFCLQDLKVRVNSRIGKDVIQAYGKQLRDALPLEPEPLSHPFGTIQRPPFHKWPPVSDSHNNLPSGDFVVE